MAKETTAERNRRVWSLTKEIIHAKGWNASIILDTGVMHAWPRRINGKRQAFGTGEVVTDRNPMRLIHRVEIRQGKPRKMAKKVSY